MGRIVGHLDMDAFFASVEERDRPYLKGSPVIIGSDPEEGKGRGVVSTANYHARKLGIGSALPISKAWQLCEDFRKEGGARCVFITAGIGKYTHASQEVFSIVSSTIPVMSQSSIDEASLDLTFCETFSAAEELVKNLKEEIYKKTNLTCSIGIGPNKMIAKIASDFDKPDGLTVIVPEEVDSFLQPLSIRSIPGVGKVTAKALKKWGVETIADVQHYSWQDLQNKFGKHGFSLWERARGIDAHPVEKRKAKSQSIGKHHTFNVDTKDIHEVYAVLQKHIKSIVKEVQKQGFSGFRTVVLTVRFEDFNTVTRSLTLDAPICSAKALELKTTKLVLPFFEKTENPKNLAIRLIGVRVEKLT
tara:strand:+ start:8100 stop:9179 length:1080 start_codon:yes stop_codon:yes gene_type:complete